MCRPRPGADLLMKMRISEEAALGEKRSASTTSAPPSATAREQTKKTTTCPTRGGLARCG